MKLTAHGAITSDYKVISKLTNLSKKIKEGKVESYRNNCYKYNNYISNNYSECIINELFSNLKLQKPKEMEIFYSPIYVPPHTDEGKLSYFIGFEPGEFFIGGISYPIVPFVLYSFDESCLHNSNFLALMIK